MHNGAVRLSICIATLNRGPFIGATLESIVSQATDDVEIVIVDGGSTDNTAEVVAQYQANFPRIHYERLPEKGGVDQDYTRTIELARGDYCWFFTDDDIMQPGAIRAVLAAARDGRDLIVVNGDVRDACVKRVLKTRNLNATSDRMYSRDDWEQLFVDTASYMSFIGCVVIRRCVWNRRDCRSYFGTVFVHVGVVFQAPMEGGAMVLAEPMISIRYGNSLWTPRSFEISLFKWPALVWSFSRFSEAALRRVSARRPWDSLTALLIYRARGVFSVAQYRQFVGSRMRPGHRRLLARVIALLPGYPLNAALIVYFSLFGWRHSDPRIRLVDLQTSRFYYRGIPSRTIAWIRAGAEMRAARSAAL